MNLEPRPLPPPGAMEPEDTTAPPPTGTASRRIGWWAGAALVFAVIVLVAGGVTAWRGNAAEQDADRELASARAELLMARGAHRRTVADLAASRAAIATFATSARGATAATARVVELQAALVDRFRRIRDAGAAGDFVTHNRTVTELNGASGELFRGFTDLEVPMQTFSTAIEGLPTVRCTGPAGDTITWTAYGANGLQCARLRVPLDYDAPRGERIEVTLVRRPADDAATSLGPLFLNPGGPGVSGISFLREALVLFPPDLLRRFDLIAFDPRGVGHSTPVDCADDLDPLFDADVTALSQRRREGAVRAVEEIIRGCARRSGKLLEHVDTMSAARDMDRMRAALGVEQLTYLGFSYGTYLGAAYADLFPHRVRAAVLDGGVDPERATSTPGVDDGTTFAAALDVALDACAADTSCPFFSDGDPSHAYDRLMLSLLDAPLDVGGRRLTRSGAELGVVSGLYTGADGWPTLMDVLAQAKAGDGRALMGLRDRYAGRRADGSYDNEFEAHYAVDCLDLQGRLTPRQAREHVRRLEHDPSRFATVSLVFALPCAFWPAPAQPAPGFFRAEGAAPILVIGGEHDPVTPIEGSDALARGFDSATLLRSAGTGHTSFARGSRCIDDAVIAYLVDLDLPPIRTVCRAE